MSQLSTPPMKRSERFLLRYGAYLLLFLLLLGIWHFGQHFSLHTKTQLQVFRSSCSHDASHSLWHGYSSLPLSTLPQPNDTLHLQQTSIGSLSFLVISSHREPSHSCLLLLPLRPLPSSITSSSPSSPSDTFLEGYIYTGEETIFSLLLRKIF